jgi:hypothetical protein
LRPLFPPTRSLFPRRSKEAVQLLITHPALLDIAAEWGEDFIKRFLRQQVYSGSPLSSLLDERRNVGFERQAIFGSLCFYRLFNVRR